MENVPPPPSTPESELREIDGALARVEAERAGLLARRAEVLAQLWGAARPVAPVGRRGETAPPTVRNVLLALGGVLLAVAVTAFTVVSWGRMGIGGRSAVLAVATLTALAVPERLLRRALTATAETVAALGLLLLVLDAYALHRVALPDTGGEAYAAGASAVLAVAWAGYGRWLGGRGPRLVPALAVLPAQAPLVLWAAAVAAGPFGYGAALLATAALDTAIALRSRHATVRTTAAVGAAVTGAAGLTAAAGMSVNAAALGEAARAAALLLGAAAALLVLAVRRGTTDDAKASGPTRTPPPRTRVERLPEVAAGVAGSALVVALGGLLRIPLPGHITVLGYLLCGTALLAAVRPVAGRRPVAAGLAAASAVTHLGALLWVLPEGAVALLGPVGWAGAVWQGAPTGARAALAPDTAWPGTLAAPAVLAVIAGSLLAARQFADGPPDARREAYRRWRRTASCGVVACSAAAAAVLPVALDLPHPVAVALLLAQTGVLLVAAGTLTAAPVSRTALCCAVVVALTAAFWGLAERPVTYGVLVALLGTFTAAAAAAPDDDRVRQPVTACVAAVCAVGLVSALCAGAGYPAHRTAFGVLAVAAGTLLVAARGRGRPAGLPLECVGGAAALLALGLAATGPAALLASALALTGVLAAGCALRTDRRRAGYAAAVLFVLATWVRLGAAGVETPEAYTLPVTVPALVVGLLRRGRDRPPSSWAGYGPGLSVTLLPSVLAVWSGGGWVRPLLLGLAALGLTLLGARRRLRAPLLLGGGALALVALHELAPYVVQIVGALPRWLPPALAGLLLLGAGATYERRLRDARRVRDVLGRMR